MNVRELIYDLAQKNKIESISICEKMDVLFDGTFDEWQNPTSNFYRDVKRLTENLFVKSYKCINKKHFTITVM